MAKTLIGLGVLLIVVGVLWHFGSQWGAGKWLGKLPGDISVERPSFKFYFPVTTSLLLSALISLILYLISRWKH